MRAILATLMLCLANAGTWAQAANDVARAYPGLRAVASYYGSGSGKRTASGARYDPLGMTYAHRVYPFGTRLRVSYGEHSVVCCVNDRGPFIKGRTLGISPGVARALGLTGAGIAHVTIERM